MFRAMLRHAARTAAAGLLGAGALPACAWAAPIQAVPVPVQAGAAFGRYHPDAPFAEAVTSSQYLSMRDGVRLAMSITRPAQDGMPLPGPFPVIWQHALAIAPAGPLAADGAGATGYRGALALAHHGYVVVQVARRGQGPSFGRRRGYNDRTEAYDAYQIIDWLAAQPWSTGAIGVYGCSNTGDASMHAVTAANPHLKAAWAGCFSWEKYDAFLRGGIFANWGTGPERTLEQEMTNTPVQGDADGLLLRRAAEDHRGATVLAAMWRAMPFRDDYAPGVGSRFWYEGSIASYSPQINASRTAIYVQGGWYDDLREQGLITFANLANERHIVIGPWTHCANQDFDLLGEMQRFFDEHLKGIDTGLSAEDPIHYFTVNASPGGISAAGDEAPAGDKAAMAGAWRSAKQWPVAGTSPTSFYLRPGSAAGGELERRAPRGGGTRTSFTIRYDLECPAVARRPGDLLTGAPPCPQPQGGPQFTTRTLGEDTEVTGDPVASLWISSTATDGNIHLYLEDVAPDGSATAVTDGRLKASLRKLDVPPYADFGLPWHRSHAQDAQPLVAGEPAQLVFNILPTSYVFKSGHRIRVSLAGADYRERDRTPVTPAPVVTLYDTPAHPSFVILPLINRHPG